MPNLSVVIPTYRRPRLLQRCLASLADQRTAAGRFEIVVVDDGSGDGTRDVLADASRRLGNLRAIVLERNAGPAAARNRGAREATADLILFLDDDVAAAPDLVETHLDYHRSERDTLVGILGLVAWHPSLRVTPFMRWLDRSGLQFGYETWLREGRIEPPYAAFYTANLSMHRGFLLESGGFDERFPYPAYEDMELAWRLAERGFRLDYRPAALAYHTRAIDLRTFRIRMTKVAESAVLLRELQPGFPLDETPPAAGMLRRRDRLRLRLAAPFARLLGRDAMLERHFRAEIAAAYLTGRRRGLGTLRAPAGRSG